MVQEQVLKMVLQLMKWKKYSNLIANSGKLSCLEITEVNPILDTKGNAMSEAAFDILQDITNKLISK